MNGNLVEQSSQQEVFVTRELEDKYYFDVFNKMLDARSKSADKKDGANSVEQKQFTSYKHIAKFKDMIDTAERIRNEAESLESEVVGFDNSFSLNVNIPIDGIKDAAAKFFSQEDTRPPFILKAQGGFGENKVDQDMARSVTDKDGNALNLILLVELANVTGGSVSVFERDGQKVLQYSLPDGIFTGKVGSSDSRISGEFDIDSEVGNALISGKTFPDTTINLPTVPHTNILS